MITSHPEPVKGCRECERLFLRWREASIPDSNRYNPSAASDCVVLIQRHAEHGEHP